MRIAFQGEIGAYSEEAARGVYPDAELVPHASFESAFEAVHEGRVDRAVLPIENSLHGSVHQNYDLLLEHELDIVAEVQLRIRHQLLGLPGASVDGLTEVSSHPQALGQCRAFLKAHCSSARIIPSYDTAGAAKVVAESGDPGRAAIASRTAAAEYGLEILASDVETDHANYTRFLALAKPDQQSDAGLHEQVLNKTVIKTSLLYSQRENVPGGLYKSLAVFALRDIDLLKIESRPLVGHPGKYVFYLDLVGHREDEAIRNALRHLAEIAAGVKVLGSYRAGHTLE